MPKMTWQYVAEFFDGEGNVSTVPNVGRHAFFNSMACMCQSQERGRILFSEIQTFLREHGIKSYLAVVVRPPHHDMWTLRIAARPSLLIFLREVLPYVRIKKLVVQDTLRLAILMPNARGSARLAHVHQKRREVRDARRAGIVADLDAGLSTSQMAEKYGVTTMAIREDMRVLGVSYRDLRSLKISARHNEICRLLDSGLNAPAIAKQLGLSLSTTYNHIAQAMESLKVAS